MSWYANATGFVPWWDTIRDDLFRNSLGRVRFADGKTGTIYLVANISSPRLMDNPLDFWALNLYYDEIPSQTQGAWVVLKAINKDSGNITNIARAKTEESVIDPLKEIQKAHDNFNHDFDFQNDFYYVVLGLKRETVVFNPTVIGAEIVAAVT